MSFAAVFPTSPSPPRLSDSTHGPDDRPLPPRAPEQGECCQSGCERCVYDVYWDAYSAYEEALKAWEARQGSADSAT